MANVFFAQQFRVEVTSLNAVVVAIGFLTPKEYDYWVVPVAMTKPLATRPSTT